jgi:predicted metalloprotease with PDZ domain
MKRRIACSYDDTGGKPAKDNNSNVFLFNLGARFAADPQGVKLLILHDDGDLQKAGLAASDVMIAIDGLKASKDNLASLLSLYSAGDTIQVHAFRRDELMDFNVMLSEAKQDTWYLEIDENNQLQSRRHAWLLASRDNVAKLHQSG